MLGRWDKMTASALVGTCGFLLHAHLVFVTKYRLRCSPPPTWTGWRRSCGGLPRLGCELAEFNGDAEHVHLLVRSPPTVALSRLVNSLKGVCSRRLRQEFPDLTRHYRQTKRLWSGSTSPSRSAVPR
jgi:REP-associated tyrosine transposase